MLKKPRPGRTAGQRKGPWAEASFCLEFCFLLVKQKEEEKEKNCQTAGQRKGPWAEASFCLVYSPFNNF